MKFKILKATNLHIKSFTLSLTNYKFNDFIEKINQLIHFGQNDMLY